MAATSALAALPPAVDLTNMSFTAAAREAEQADDIDMLKPMLGDIVQLGSAAPPECIGRLAVVTNVAEAHCTAVTLDSSQQFGEAECWPYFKDIIIERRTLRLGSRVVIHGLQSSKTCRFNGFTGCIVAHPREGHPAFISKPSAADRQLLAVTVKFDDTARAGLKSLIVEPRFLLPYDEYIMRLTHDVLASVESCPCK